MSPDSTVQQRNLLDYGVANYLNLINDNHHNYSVIFSVLLCTQPRLLGSPHGGIALAHVSPLRTRLAQGLFLLSAPGGRLSDFRTDASCKGRIVGGSCQARSAALDCFLLDGSALHGAGLGDGVRN